MAGELESAILRELHSIAVEIRALRAGMRAAMSLDAQYQGSDDTGTVSVVVGGRGTVQDVHLDARWARAVGESRLGAALLAAYQVAAMASLTALAERIDRVDRDGWRVEEPATPQREEPAPASPPRRATQGEIDALLDDVYRGLRRVDEIRARSTRNDEQQPTAVTSRRGMFEITVQDHRIAAVSMRGGSLAASPVSEIEREALSAFRAAEHVMSRH